MRKKVIFIHAFSPAAVLRVEGDDAFQFLQGQFTNDLRGPIGSVSYGLWLNQKGKVLADSEILKISDREFLLTSAFSPASTINQRLEQYIIADDVTLNDQTASTRSLIIWSEGSDAEELVQKRVGETPVKGRFVETQGMWVSHERFGDQPGFKVMGSSRAIQDLHAAMLAQGDVVEASADEVEQARIEAGIPAIPRDIGPADLPQEAGLEATMISFTKGCYLGQEVMARLKSMGQVRRQLLRVRGTGPAPANGAHLFQGTKKVGEIRSAVATKEGFVALAMVTRLGLDENAGLALDSQSDGKSTVSLWKK